MSFTSALPTSPQAGDVPLLETMEFGAFERLPLTVTEADPLRDIQIHRFISL